MAMTPRAVNDRTNWWPDNAPAGVIHGGQAVAGDLVLIIGGGVGAQAGNAVSPPNGYSALYGSVAAAWPTVFVWSRILTGAGDLSGYPTGWMGGGQGVNWYTRTIILPAGSFDPVNPPIWVHVGSDNAPAPGDYLFYLWTTMDAHYHPHIDGSFAASLLMAERRDGSTQVGRDGAAAVWATNPLSINHDGFPSGSHQYVMRTGYAGGAMDGMFPIRPLTTGQAHANVTWRKLSVVVAPKARPIQQGVNLYSQVDDLFTFSTSAAYNPDEWRWSPGDGGAESVGGSSYQRRYQWGTYQVGARAQNNAGQADAWAYYSLTVPRPTVTGVSHTQTNDRVDLAATTSGIPSWATFTWDPGDGSAPIDTNTGALTHYYPPGDYTVTVTVTAATGQSETLTYALAVDPPAPTASFIYARTPGTYDVLFRDRSTFVETRQWSVDGQDFGSGEAEYLHVFPGAGQYTVRLTVSNVTGTTWTERVVILTDEYTALDRQDGITVALVLDAQDISCEVQAASWSFGASDDEGPLTVQRSGQLRLRLRDEGRDLDPWQNGARYGDAAAVGHNVFFYVGRTGSVDPLTLVWRGWVSETSHDGWSLSLTGYDSIGRLAATIAGQDGPQARPQETLYDRLVALLDIAGWPSSLRDIVGGDQAEVRSTTFAGQDIWTQLQRAASGVGFVSVLPDGTVRYRDGYDTSGDVVQVADGPHGLTGPVLPLVADGLADAAAVARVINDAVVGNDIIGATRVQDAASQTEHGLQSTNITTDLVTVAARDALAQALVDHLSTPRLQVQAETLIGGAEIVDAAPIRFGRPGHVRVVDPPKGPDVDRDALLVLGGSWTMSRTTTRLTLALAMPNVAAPARAASYTTSGAEYGAGGLFVGVNDHDHQGGILRPADIERALVGIIVPYAGATAPRGWLFCNGGSYSATAYPDLFAVLGYTYGGSGDTFQVPNLNDTRFVLGNEPSVRGQTGGTGSHDHGTHNHWIDAWTHGNSAGQVVRIDIIHTNVAVTAHQHHFQALTGSNSAVSRSHYPPYFRLPYIIRAT